MQLFMMNSGTLSFSIAFLLKTDALAWCLDPGGADMSARVV